VTKEQIKEIESRDKPADHMMIYAPMGGIVIEKFKQQGDRVNTGERIYTVADLSHLWVRLHAFESDLMWLRYGQTATFTTDAYPGEEFVGRIAFIDPVLDDRTRTVNVRVNIDNTEGKLKPDMFVRGIVKAKVAAGGRVIDADLEGKWISPMHPEIVKDEPGTCDICGMPLVRAESLGYVAARTAGLEKPLVIPVSAALITGTRAIVYVEDPKAKEPTFEGREIVLGPRAGDYYLVRSGLHEGELVVTSGNFKIDSALQILAKPSMMTPEGGGGGGQHHHGEGDTKQPNAHAEHGPGATGQAAPMVMELPISIHQKLHAIIEAQRKITAAVKNTDLATARIQFVAVGKAAQSIDTSLLDGHPKLILKELEMLIANDAIEGGTLTDIANAERVLASLTRNIERLDRQFGILQAGHLPERLEVPPEFRIQLAALWTDYGKIGDALANDDFDAAKSASRQLATSLTGVDMKLLSDNDAHMLWMKEARNLTAIGKSLVEAKDIKTTREHFEPLSGVMQALAMTFGFGPEQPVYLLHCPMAFGNTGASWLQKDDQTRNPYFGATMLQCADRKELISGDHTASKLRAPTTNGKAEGTK
jgi:Cu(I)/Ag(I) efflux system membrane fusion protein